MAFSTILTPMLIVSFKTAFIVLKQNCIYIRYKVQLHLMPSKVQTKLPSSTFDF